jgi:8-oxo-dGTP pyrophosphatase MutT (NUDIX family)
MTTPMIKQLPLHFGTSDKSAIRTQFAALCYRVKSNKVQILLVTTRRTGRWIMPKGWPIDGLTPQDSAACEAWEEAGVVGQQGGQHGRPLGLYSYTKMLDDTEGLPCVVMVYPVLVKSLSDDFPEKSQRTRKWFSQKQASALVGEPELARILRDFDPRALR